MRGPDGGLLEGGFKQPDVLSELSGHHGFTPAGTDRSGEDDLGGFLSATAPEHRHLREVRSGGPYGTIFVTPHYSDGNYILGVLFRSSGTR